MRQQTGPATIEPQPPRTALHRSVLAGQRKKEPAGLADLARQLEADYQFKLANLVLRSLVQSATVTVEAGTPRDAAPREVERARALADNLEEVWRRTLPSMLEAIGLGRAAFEKTFRHDPALELYLLADLDYLPFERTSLALDEEGSFAGIELSAGEASGGFASPSQPAIRLEPARAWWFALDPTVLEPHGRSRYLGAAREVFLRRRELDRLEAIWYSKFAIGHAVARAPDRGETDPVLGPGGREEEWLDPIEVLRDRCQEIESGGVLVLSSKTSPDGKYLYDYVESAGQKDGAPLENRRRQLDVAALRAMGIPERAITQDGQTGSYALADVHQSVLEKTCEGILGQATASFEKYVAAKAAELNWPIDRRPRFRVTFQPLGDDRRGLVLDLVRTLAPRLLEEGRLDADTLLAIAGLPIHKPGRSI